MSSLRIPTAPPLRPKVDPITHKEAWDFVQQSLNDVEFVSGKRAVIAKLTFQEHPKKTGDFNEFVELELGGVLTKINLRFVCGVGLYLEVLNCDPHKQPKRVFDECLTNRTDYQDFLGYRLVESICRQLPV